MVSLGHLLNDMFQAVIPAIYPMIKESLGLSFMQIGAITLTNQITSSLLQPVVGYFSDKHPRPYGLVVGMCFTLTGLLLLSVADSFPFVLLSVAFVGVGSSVLHPESSKVARLASGGAKGMAQSIFQIGGNVGRAIGEADRAVWPEQVEIRHRERQPSVAATDCRCPAGAAGTDVLEGLLHGQHPELPDVLYD